MKDFNLIRKVNPVKIILLLLYFFIYTSFKIDNPKSESIKIKLNGFWKNIKFPSYGILFSDRKYCLTYHRYKNKRICDDDYLADDIVPHISLFEYELKYDTILSGIPKYRIIKVTNGTLTFIDLRNGDTTDI